jgi:hypothetical protein
VHRWCEQRVPAHARDQVRVECDIGPRQLTIVECRPPRREGTGTEWTRFPIARLLYMQATRMWTLGRRTCNKTRRRPVRSSAFHDEGSPSRTGHDGLFSLLRAGQ